MNLATSIGEFLSMTIIGLLVAFPTVILLRSLHWNKIWRRLLRLFNRDWRPIYLHPYSASASASTHNTAPNRSRRDAD